jgi:hypothetical protein
MNFDPRVLVFIAVFLILAASMIFGDDDPK